MAPWSGKLLYGQCVNFTFKNRCNNFGFGRPCLTPLSVKKSFIILIHIKMKLFTKTSKESLILILFLSFKCAQISIISLSERVQVVFHLPISSSKQKSLKAVGKVCVPSLDGNTKAWLQNGNREITVRDFALKKFNFVMYKIPPLSPSQE